MAETYLELKRRILAKRMYCEADASFILHLANELNHGLVKRKKGHPEYDVEINLEPVCSLHHTTLEARIHSYEHRRDFAERQAKIYGFDVRTWYRSLNLKSPEAWLWNFEIQK